MEREKIASGLLKKGFIEDSKGRDHRYFHHQINGKEPGYEPSFPQAANISI